MSRSPQLRRTLSRLDHSDSGEENEDNKLVSQLRGLFQPSSNDVDTGVRRLHQNIMDAEPQVWYECAEILHSWKDSPHSVSTETYTQFFICGPDSIGKAHDFLLFTIEQTSAVGVNKMRVREFAQNLTANNPGVIRHAAHGGETALHCCARKNNGRVMKDLIDALKCSGDLDAAMRQTAKVEQLPLTPLEATVRFNHKRGLEILIKEASNDLASSYPTILSFALKFPREELALVLMKACPELLFRDSAALGLIVKQGAGDIWNRAKAFLIKRSPDLPFHPRSSVLRAAIESLNESVVREIVSLQPSLVTQEWQSNGQEQSTLDLISIEAGDNSDIKMKKDNIRQLLVPVFVTAYSINTLKEKFRKAEMTPNLISLNLQELGAYDNREIFEFIKLLKGSETKPIWENRKYETALRIVRLPALQETAHGGPKSWETSVELQSKHMEFVADIFTWLKSKHVSSVHKVVVPDSFYVPVPEHAIETALDGLNVQVLDWKRPDLSIDTISAIGHDSLKKLYLYSSGNRSVIRQWLGPDGIRTLPKLEEVELTVCTQNLDINKHDSSNTDSSMTGRLKRLLDEQLEQLQVGLGERKLVIHPPKFKAWDSRTLSFFGRLHPGRPALPAPLYIPAYENFRQAYFSVCSSIAGLTPTRVAIIDNGVDEHSLGRHATKSWSFIDDDDDNESDPAITSHPHGTHMAMCVNYFDPHCELYVAKVGRQTQDFTNSRVQNAISWAIQENVDIISLSLTFSKKTQDLNQLKRIIGHAVEEKKILVFCSTSDGDTRSEGYFPAGCPDAWGVTTTERRQIHEPTTSDKSAHYMIGTHQVSMEMNPYRNFPAHWLTAEGTSVATSMVAGLASMILMCGRAANANRIDQRRTFVQSRLSARIGGETALVDPNVLCGVKVPEGIEDTDKFEAFLKKHFREE